MTLVGRPDPSVRRVVEPGPSHRPPSAAPAISVALLADGPTARLVAPCLEAAPGIEYRHHPPGAERVGRHQLIVLAFGRADHAGTIARIDGLRRTIPVLAIGPVALATRALRLGAVGYLGPDDVDHALAAAIVATAGGRRFVGPSVADAYLGDRLASAAEISRLSSRELEVVCRAGRGESPATSADALGLAPEAVTQYRLRARAKLGLRTTRDLRSFAVANGLR